MFIDKIAKGKTGKTGLLFEPTPPRTVFWNSDAETFKAEENIY